MPPKKKGGDDKPKSSKSAVDKTFGMKNKKGAQAQKQIALIKQQQSQAKSPEEKKKEAEKAQREKDKKAAEDAKKEAAELFKPVQVQKVPFGVDPKTVVCQFFKKGACEKGRKCKFSHDLAIERKVEKKDLYSDTRDNEEETKEKDNMDDWDEGKTASIFRRMTRNSESGVINVYMNKANLFVAKLRQVVLSKHGNPRTTTDKVCKYFIEAVENGKYGWFWTCPNGGDKCMYKHSLPPGFVLKTKEQRAAEKALMDKSPLKTLTLEDFIESERHKLVGPFTPVTAESFAKWKKERLDKKAAEAAMIKAKDATGRAMFESGDWKGESDDEGDDDADDFARLRLETQEEQRKREEERFGGGIGLGKGAVGDVPDDTSEGEDSGNG